MVFYVMPSQTPIQIHSSSDSKTSYADSSGSCVHVFCFDHNLNLLPIRKDLELFLQTKPGLSSYASNPRSAALSLSDLLHKAEAAIPKDLRPFTPIRVGATAGLRALGVDAFNRILQGVRDLLKQSSSLSSQPDAVTVIDGTKVYWR
ncbi:hypothetical protein ACLB2K_035155 [Fragaria x ananassa]